MSQCIIYKNDEGGISIVYPAPGMDVNAVALKDVPRGKPFKIADISDIPTDRSDRNLWGIDNSELTDGVGDQIPDPPIPPAPPVRPVTPGGFIKLRLGL